jgi:methylenetetrahydrofolate reductase (NADPH)
MINVLAETLRARRFCYVAELVASGQKTEAQVLDTASNIGRVPGIAALSVTNYAGGRAGHDPVRIAEGLQTRDIAANVHVTCVGQDRRALAKTIRELAGRELFNVFALTGDWPKEAGATPVFDIDSVQLTHMMSEMRGRHGTPFHISVAVSPFKYQREDCLYQYLKLEKKIAAGADFAITQVGWDALKFAELKQYLDEHGLTTPIVGNVYALSLRTAERMAGGSPPGCWASPELVEQIRREAQAPDGGVGARLERAAKTAAILKGLGYAGAYLGGTHDVQHLAYIIRRGEELAPRWQEFLAELQFGKKDGFYLSGERPKPRPTLIPLVLDTMGRTLPVPWSKGETHTWARRRLQALFTWIDRHPILSKAFERFEYYGKRAVFGCQNCGNCVLGHMEYVCPQTCPKQMRNGPCGGTHFGRCEVIDQECIWVRVMDRAEATDRIPDLKTYIPPPDRALQGTSSWLNFYLERDSRPGRPKGDIEGAEPPAVAREQPHTAA